MIDNNFDNDRYNQITLHKYLTFQLIQEKNYPKAEAKKKATELIRTSTNLWGKNGLAYYLGQKSFEFFCLYYLQDIFVAKPTNKQRGLAPVHYEMWNFIDEMFIKDYFDKGNMVIPRGCAKTTVCDLALTIWLHCYKQSIFTIIGAKKERDAKQFMDNIRTVFENNPNIIKTFGKLIDTKKFTVNSEEIELANGTDIQIVSSGASVRGMNYRGIRPTCFIGDDFQDEADVLTEEASLKKWDKWCKEIEEFGDTATYRDGIKVGKATKILSIGTIMKNNCLISRLCRQKDYKTLLKRAIILEGGQKIEDIFDKDLWLECKRIYFDNKRDNPYQEAKDFYIENKEAMYFPILWEDKWDRFEDLAVKYWKNREAFMTEKMNDAATIGEKKFKSNRTESPEEINKHNFLKTMLCIDPAGTNTKVKGKKKDYFAFLVGSLSDNGFKYCRKGELLKFEHSNGKEYDAYIKHTLDLLKKYKDITHIWIEKNTYGGADAIRIREELCKDHELRCRDIEIINTSQNKNKDDKISTIVGDVNNGRIIFNSEDTEFIEQIMEFQGCNYSAHDDAADITSEFNNRIDEIEVLEPIDIYKISDLFRRR
ncbi:terminase [Pseudobacteroides cellulosolvens]|uniref:Terminase large subunit gp17-like C-terminal domain-containing protein n=1 Tax=Pseudobacteroides cellulosolvens ATCC 35603 = DSM 2933 TaxID=398512 RepID=A0A0L6JGJ7_9FIRM|nr:terminase [Pseudobacteroides cellulosolvens]KNY24991.1 hypothetical protein Bccel_0248 [Pseudobacteroides cellulosolvens ATCC 35603 = DSM 2933]